MEFPVVNGKIALVRASMVATYYIKIFRTGADRSNGILMYFLLLVAETLREIEQKFHKDVNNSLTTLSIMTSRVWQGPILNSLFLLINVIDTLKEVKCGLR